MYIALPACERVFHRGDLAAIQKYEHGTYIAAALTNTQNVRIRYFEGAHVLGIVIKCLREQKNGSSYNTLDDLIPTSNTGCYGMSISPKSMVVGF